MRKISLLQQTLGRHSPQHWFSGLVAFLICLVNVFSVVGIGFSLPTSQAASLAHSARSTQSAQQALQHGMHAQVSTQKAPQHSLKTQTPVQKTPQHSLKTQSPAQKTIPNKSTSAPLVRLRPHVSTVAGAVTPTTLTIADVATTTTAGSTITTLNVGDNVTYTLTVTNTAGTAITSGTITVTDTIPAGFNNIAAPVVAGTTGNTGWTPTISSTTGPATITATTTISGGGLLAAGVLPNLVITAKPDGTAYGVLPNTATVATNSDTPNAQLAAAPVTVLAPDLKITQTHSPTGTTFQVGQSIAYTLMVANNGSATPLGTLPVGQIITVTDTLPTGFTITGINSGAWSILPYLPNATTITATYTVPAGGAIVPTGGGPIPASGSSSITITGNITAASVGTITNTATVRTPLDLLATGETEQTSADTVTVAALPDLYPTLTVTNTGCSTPPATPIVSYALTVSNTAGNGPVLSTVAAPTPISVTVTAPTNLTSPFLTASTPSDWSIVGLTATYRGTYPVYPGTPLSSITISGTPVLASTSPIVLSAKVFTANSATTTIVDANPLNDTATSTFTPCAPNLAIAVTHAGTAPFAAGQNITYTIAVTNTSPVPVPAGSAITVADTLPAGLTNTWALGSNWALSISNGTLSATYVGSYPVATGVLPPITVYGTLTSATGATATNTAMVTTTPATGTATTSSATDTFAVTTFTNTPDVAISFVHTGTACMANNGSVTYTLGVTNSAAAAILAGQVITVNATLPMNLTGITVSTPGSWALSFNGNVMTGVYSAPVAIGAALPAITIMGNLTNVTAATLTSTATVALANDTSAANNTATDILTICTPDLAIVKTHVGTGPFKVGTAVTFNLAVTNVGTAPILAGQPITVTDLVPSGISSVTATAATEWTITSTGNTIIANYSGTYPVAPAAVLTPILVSGQIASLNPVDLTNTATVYTPSDVNLKNNTSTDSLIATSLTPDLSVKIDSPNSCVSKNNNVTFTFKVSNGSGAGPIAVSTPITLTFREPTGLDQISYSGSNWTWKKDGAIITATYTHNGIINGGDNLSAFALTGDITQYRGTNIWIGIRVYTHDDSNRSNDIDSNTVHVC